MSLPTETEFDVEADVFDSREKYSISSRDAQASGSAFQAVTRKRPGRFVQVLRRFHPAACAARLEAVTRKRPGRFFQLLQTFHPAACAARLQIEARLITKIISLSLLFVFGLFPLLAAAQDAKARKGRDTYMGRAIAPAMSHLGADWLIRAERESEEDPKQMLSKLGLKPGMVVCDMGCGNGFYSLTMAESVSPGGKVLAVDIQPQMLQLLSRRSAEAKIENIDMILGTLTDPKLPDGQVDLVLMVDVYHEFSHPVEMLAAIRKSLTPTGRIALVEFRAEDPSVPIKPEHKMSKKQILKEYKANGFELDSEYDGLPWQHLMFFKSDNR